MLPIFTGKLGGDLKGLLPSPSVIALSDQVGTRCPIKTLTEGLYLKIVNGNVVCAPAEGGGGVDDHEVKASDSDTGHGSLINKIKNTTDISWTTIVDGGIQKIIPTINFPTFVDDHLVKARNADSTTVGGLQEKSSPGVGIKQAIKSVAGVETLETSVTGLVVAIDPATQNNNNPDRPAGLYERLQVQYPLTETVAGISPERYVLLGVDLPQEQPGAGAKYFTGQIDNPNIKLAKALMSPMDRWPDCAAWAFGYLSLADKPPYYSAWHETSHGSGVWRANLDITDPSFSAAYFDGVTPTLGMRFFVYYYDDPTQLPYQGVYVVTALGNTGSYAEIQRYYNDPSDFKYGKPVHITGGNSAANHTFKYAGADNPNLDTSPLSFIDSGTNSIYAHSGFFGFGSVWTPVSGQPYTWTKNGEGFGGVGTPPKETYGIAANGSATIQFQTGDKFLIVETNDYYNESAHFGYYEFVSYDTINHIQTIRRCLDANTPATLTGLIAYINNPNAFNYGGFYTETATVATVDTSATEWTVSVERPAGDTRGLYTSSQLVSLGVSLNTYTKTLGCAPSAIVWQDAYETTAIGVDKIPAGRQHFKVNNVYLSDFGGTPGVAKLYVKLFCTDGLGGVIGDILTSEYGPITWSTPQDITWFYDLVTDYTLAPTNTVVLQFGISTTYSNFAEITFTYNSPARGTWWQSSIENGTLGIGDHQLLINRFPDVGKGEAPAHNMDGLGAGFLHTPFPSIVTLDTGGWLPKPLRNELLIANDASNWLQGIEYTEKFGGDKLYLTFLNGIRIYHNASVVSKPGYAPLYLTFNGVTPLDINWLTPSPRPNGRIVLQLRTDTNITPNPCWQLIAMTPGPLTP